MPAAFKLLHRSWRRKTAGIAQCVTAVSAPNVALDPPLSLGAQFSSIRGAPNPNNHQQQIMEEVVVEIVHVNKP